MVATWRRAPLQALARLHLLAAADLVEDAEELGRPRTEPGVAERLDGSRNSSRAGRTRRAPVLAAVVHGELSVLKPFGVADGIVARAASRLVCVASGLDTRNLGVPEVHWMRRLQAYRDGVDGFGAGTVEGVGGWVLFCCGSLEAGAREAGSIAERSPAECRSFAGRGIPTKPLRAKPLHAKAGGISIEIDSATR